MSIGLGGLVFIIFLFLKLAGIGMVAEWSWWWVTCPIWIGVAVSAFFIFFVAAFGLLTAAVTGRN